MTHFVLLGPPQNLQDQKQPDNQFVYLIQAIYFVGEGGLKVFCLF